jgi:multidrug resistance efflux pump
MGIVIIASLLTIFLFWQTSHKTVFIENSIASAPIIDLSPSSPGTLNALYVKEGDYVLSGATIALVGTDTITSKLSGIITKADNNLGSLYSPGKPVVSMIHPEDMRIVGTLEENKGLQNISVGDPVIFTIDTYGSKKYSGTVDTVSPTAESTNVVFSISDKRPTQKFDVKVKFNVAEYPEIKNGMSARITVYTK